MTNDTDTFDPVARGLGVVRTILGVSGILTLLLGLAILIWPGRTAEVLVALLAIYTVVTGLVYVGTGIRATMHATWSRIASVVLGIFLIVAGIIAFANIGAATDAFIVVIGVLVGIAWIAEGILELAFGLNGIARPRGWTIAFAVISILAGVLLLFSPMLIAVMWIWLGVLAVVLGIAQIIDAFQIGRLVR
ncbi:hypothetical protein GCM10009785_22330 [Brooklawnia cerclae]|uniref:Uncharacterized membrane protein HdeD (DUF308 family) n=1 Tax=Brooklawnia cerclae TaxID=349934 RepID=A0ABX0SFF9_9ACTN|nr:DUF308 domain-containing protein [Brooklawnia cerclae]NIH57133.1 uncharacterized membrane protein HdeD (DUF308 family) [Brooklawnia cerclae]